MTTQLHKLQPSTIAPVSLEVLRGLPAGGIYLYSIADFEAVVRIDRWSGGLPRCSVWGARVAGLADGYWLPSGEARVGRFQYPRLPALSFTMTDKQMSTPSESPSGRAKWVTRRKNIPKWAQPGRLFMAWHRSHRGGAGLARGLGTFRVRSVETQGRHYLTCQTCDVYKGQDVERGDSPGCARCASELNRHENLTPAELAAEGFPDMAPDDFWSLLVKAGNVREDGTVARIEFAAV